MAYYPTTPMGAGWQKIADTSTTQNHALGTIVSAVDPTYGAGEFIYLKGVASTVVGSWVVYSADDWSTALITANAKGPVAVAMSANVASSYGWYQISGKAIGKSTSTVADNADLYIGGTGVVSDEAVTGDRIHIAKAASSQTSDDTIECEIARSFVDDGAGGGTS